MKLELVKQMVNAPATAVEMIEHNEVGNNWMTTYGNYHKGDASRKWEQEKVLIIQALNENNKLANCTRFSLYTAMHRLAISGLTLNEGMAYLLPFGQTAVFVPGYKGRLEQINQMPDVNYVHDPQIVYSCDAFEYELGERPRIIKHVPKLERPADAKIIMAYLVIETKNGTEIKFLDRDKAYAARAKSPAWKYWDSLLRSGKKINDNGTITVSNNTSSWECEPPLWVSDEPQAWKKTITKRAYDSRPNKLAFHKEIDDYEKEAGITEQVEVDTNGGAYTPYIEVPQPTQPLQETPQTGTAPENDPNYKGF